VQVAEALVDVAELDRGGHAVGRRDADQLEAG
jgi:hypothetical protein